MITEEYINSLSNIQLNFKSNKYPIPVNKHLPRMYFVYLGIGSRGSGKTYSCVKLLKAYESGIVDAYTKNKMSQRIILFSPTVDANPVFNSLTHLHEDDIHTEYNDNMLLEVIDDIKRERIETIEYQRKSKLYRKFIRIKRIDDLSYEELLQLEKMDYEPPKMPKYYNGCVVHLILDDLVGSSAFKSVGKSALTNIVLKNRHLGINIIILSQNLKAIPKSIRTNTSIFCLFKFANNKILDDLYEEVSNTLTLEQFHELYEYATSDEHDYLFVDFTQPKELRFKKNLDKILSINK
jgi:hypothetical protein